MAKKSKTAKKTKSRKKINPKNDGFFCTECGEELDEFCFSDKSKDKGKVYKNHEKCLKTGKFSGEFCSKMFISSESLLDEIWEDKIEQ